MAEMDEAPERARQAIEADTLDAIDGDRVRFENTGNPLFAWQALVSWRSLNRNRTRAQVAPLPMPGWVEDYLDRAGPRIMRLAHGHDFERAVTVTRGSTQVGARGREPRRGEPRITPAEAMKRVPAALGLIDKRWNAFRHLCDLNSQEIDEISVELYKGTDPRVTDTRAFAMLREDKGVGDERDVRRRIAKARAARGVRPVR